jgi:hypothetical protein
LKYGDFDIVFANMPISDGLKQIIGERHAERPHLILMVGDDCYYCLNMTGSKLEMFTQYHIDKNDYALTKSTNINLDKIYILRDGDIKNYVDHLNNRDIDLLTRLSHTIKHKWDENYRAMFEKKHCSNKDIIVGSVIVNNWTTYVVYNEDNNDFNCLKVNKIIREDKNVFATDYIVDPIFVNINKSEKSDLIDNVDEKTIAHLLLTVKNKLTHKVDIGNLINYMTYEGFKKLMVIGFDNERIYMIDRDTFFEKKNFYIILKNSNIQVAGTVSKNELKKFLDFYFENYNKLSFDTNMYCQKVENSIEETYKTL